MATYVNGVEQMTPEECGKFQRVLNNTKFSFPIAIIALLIAVASLVISLFDIRILRSPSQFSISAITENSGTVLEVLTAKQFVVVDEQGKERIKLHVDNGIANIEVLGADSDRGGGVNIQTSADGDSNITFDLDELGGGGLIQNNSLRFWNGKESAHYSADGFSFFDKEGAVRMQAGTNDDNGRPFIKLSGSGVTLDKILENEKQKEKHDWMDISFGFGNNSQPYIELNGLGESGITLGTKKLESLKTGTVTEKPAGSITIFDKVGRVLWDAP